MSLRRKKRHPVLTEPVIKAVVTERVNRVAHRSEQAMQVLRSQRDRNHFAERLRHTLGGT
jgi:hypothetical protein